MFGSDHERSCFVLGGSVPQPKGYEDVLISLTEYLILQYY